MAHIVQSFFVINGEVKPVTEYISSNTDGGIYEVLRVIKRVPLFCEEHLLRFEQSAQIAGVKIPYEQSRIKKYLIDLIEQNNVSEGNIMISYYHNFEMFFIPHKYPSEKQYRLGVKCDIFEAERLNPNAKIFQNNIRQQANNMLKEQDAYEVLLVDKNGNITEGSRSNVFFIKGEEIITPLGNSVLLGITRKKTIKAAEMLGISLKEQEIKLNDLSAFDAAFITGTSPDILPISIVNECRFQVDNNVLRKLMNGYKFLVDEYVKDFKG